MDGTTYAYRGAKLPQLQGHSGPHMLCVLLQTPLETVAAMPAANVEPGPRSELIRAVVRGPASLGELASPLGISSYVL